MLVTWLHRALRGRRATCHAVSARDDGGDSAGARCCGAGGAVRRALTARACPRRNEAQRGVFFSPDAAGRREICQASWRLAARPCTAGVSRASKASCSH
eukprot:1993526-Pleurochrysis_carterae.AAC.5